MSSRMDALMIAALMSSMGRDSEVSPLTVKITLTPFGLSSSMEASKRVIHDFHAEEWLKETGEKLAPVMREQTDKFAELLREKFGLEVKKVEDSLKDGEIPVPDILKEIFKDMLGGQK